MMQYLFHSGVIWLFILLFVTINSGCHKGHPERYVTEEQILKENPGWSLYKRPETAGPYRLKQMPKIFNQGKPVRYIQGRNLQDVIIDVSVPENQYSLAYLVETAEGKTEVFILSKVIEKPK